jgi:hypothetical protein
LYRIFSTAPKNLKRYIGQSKLLRLKLSSEEQKLVAALPQFSTDRTHRHLMAGPGICQGCEAPHAHLVASVIVAVKANAF